MAANDDASTGTERFEELVAALAAVEAIDRRRARGFGQGALTIGGTMFAVPHRFGLLLKLPAARVAALLQSGDGLAFDAGRGRAMKEWVVIKPGSADSWQLLAVEALRFVRDAMPSRRARERRRS